MKIGKQRRRTTLKDAMANELGDPAASPDSKCNLVGWVWLGGGEMFKVCGCADEDWCEERAGHGLQEDVEDGVVGRGYGAGVEVEIGYCEPGWEWDECG